MRPRFQWAAAALFVLLCSIVIRAGAQGTPPPPQGTPPGGAGQGAGQGRGRGGGGGGQAIFPAQQRPPGDPAAIARGKALYEINCRACHGTDLRGGDMGGPNLLRSQLVLADQFGEGIGPVLLSGRQTPGMPVMPPVNFPPDDVKAVAAYIHSVAATMRGQGNPPPGAEPVVLNIVVGDAAAGQAYFAAKCSACHSTTGDLAGIASRISDPTQLQNAWVSGSSGGGRGGRGGRGGGAAGTGAPERRQITVTVTQPNGQKIEGPLVRIDDFIVILTTADGMQRSFRRDGDVPKVEVRDPMDGHRNLLPGYTNKDIHDVTAYLVTVK
jgi:cytochrome c oxidase cbb3-type subunit 3